VECSRAAHPARIAILAGAVAAFSAAATVGDLLSPVFLSRCPLGSRIQSLRSSLGGRV